MESKLRRLLNCLLDVSPEKKTSCLRAFHKEFSTQTFLIKFWIPHSFYSAILLFYVNNCHICSKRNPTEIQLIIKIIYYKMNYFIIKLRFIKKNKLILVVLHILVWHVWQLVFLCTWFMSAQVCSVVCTWYGTRFFDNLFHTISTRFHWPWSTVRSFHLTPHCGKVTKIKPPCIVQGRQVFGNKIKPNIFFIISVVHFRHTRRLSP